LIVADTSGLLAFFDASEAQYDSVRALIEQERDPPVVSPYVIAELDYLIGSRWGLPRELAALQELAGGAWELATIEAADLARAAEVIERYRDQAVGVTDASIVVLADRYHTRTVLTLDHRHFDVLRPLSGGRFNVVP
jgi:uncharacterized protein